MTDTDRCVCGHWWAEHKPAGCYARTGVDEWCNCPAAGDPSQPTTRKPFPGGVDNTVGGWVLFRPDPVGDDTPAPTAGRWTVDEHGDIYFHHPDQMEPFGVNGMSPVGEALAELIRRAGAAPDLTALPSAEDVQAWQYKNQPFLVPQLVAIERVLAAVAALVRDTPETDDG